MTDTEIYTQGSRWSLILGTLHGFNGRLYICIKFSSGLMVKNPPANEGDQDGFDPWSGKIPWRRKWQSTPIFLPEKIAWTEEPGGLQSMGLQNSWTQFSD